MDESEYKLLTDSLNHKLEQFYVDPTYQAPAERGRTLLTTHDRQQMVDNFEREHIYDYEPSRLSEVQVQKLIQDIDQLVRDSSDIQRVTHLTELKEFVERNGYIFPELSHGGSSSILSSVLDKGLRPRALVPDRPQFRANGEGDRFKSSKHRARSISMGIGQGGLGTTIAYGRLVDKPWWNYNRLSKAELAAQLKNEYTKLGAKDESQMPDVAYRLNQIRSAIVHKDSGIPLDYPIVLGYSRVDKSGGPYPDNPNYQFQTTKTYQEGDTEARSLKYSQGLDSEVLVKEDTIIDADELKVVACNADKMNEVQEALNDRQMENVQLISLEALDELKNLGITRVAEGEKRAYGVLTMNSLSDFITSNKLKNVAT